MSGPDRQPSTTADEALRSAAWTLHLEPDVWDHYVLLAIAASAAGRLGVAWDAALAAAELAPEEPGARQAVTEVAVRRGTRRAVLLWVATVAGVAVAALVAGRADPGDAVVPVALAALLALAAGWVAVLGRTVADNRRGATSSITDGSTATLLAASLAALPGTALVAVVPGTPVVGLAALAAVVVPGAAALLVLVSRDHAFS